MPIGQAVMIALSGFLVVFLMLCILWGLIVLISKFVKGLTQKQEAAAFKASQESALQTQTEAASETVKAAEPEKEVVHLPYGGEIALFDVDEKTAACIMASVADSTKIPLDHLIFKSIRALD